MILQALKYVTVLSVAFCLPWTPVYAQNVGDTTLQEYRLTGKHAASGDTRVNDFSPGLKLLSIDTATMAQFHAQSLAALMAQQTATFVKSYGFNGLATLNFRGASAAQSAVYWNGVPLQNAATGVADISTIPVLLLNRINIQYGSSAALWGSANVGGALLLETGWPGFDSSYRRLSVSIGSGSFGQYTSSVKAEWGRRRWSIGLAASAQSAQNDFSYLNNGLKTDLTNSRLRSLSVQLTGGVQISPRDVLTFAIWQQRYDREIPPATFERLSEKQQSDRGLRTVAEWRRTSSARLWYARSSLTSDELRYEDATVLLNTRNQVFQYFQEFGLRQRYNWGQLLLFSPQQVSWMGQGISGQVIRGALAGAVQIPLLHQKVDVALSNRGEAISQVSADTTKHNLVVLPGINVAYNAGKWLVLRASVQRTYRTPSLNELFYQPGGNAVLLPERGWAGEAGYKAQYHMRCMELQHDVAYFNRHVQDWIVWMGGAIWTPHNIAAVYSRGVETENRILVNVGKWNLSLGLNTAYTLATTTSSYLPLDGSIGKQIPYSPRYNGQVHAGLDYARKLFFTVTQAYTGYRFTTTDESQYLPPYYTTNAHARWRLKVRRQDAELLLQCNNIFNVRYEVVNGRPMPGFNWLAAFKVSVE